MEKRYCTSCRGELTPIQHESRLEQRRAAPIVILIPAWRCEPCRATSADVFAARLAGEGAPTVIFLEHPWREVDRPERAEECAVGEDEVASSWDEGFDLDIPAGWEDRVGTLAREEKSEELGPQVLDGRPYVPEGS